MDIKRMKTAKELFQWWKEQNDFTCITFKYRNGEIIQGYDEYKDLPLLSITEKGKEIIAVVDAIPKETVIKWK